MPPLLAALRGEHSGPPPIWLMRQAGRYLPQYRALKKERPLYDLFHDPEQVVAITELPLRLFPLDAAILFSDILTVLDGLHLPYHFAEKGGPQVLAGPEEIRLGDPETCYSFLGEAIRALKQTLKVPLLGFAGAPFTLASYILEGNTSREGKKTKQRLFQDPEGFHALLRILTQATQQYLNYQIAAGVDAVQIFDSAAHLLGVDLFRQVCLPYLGEIVRSVQSQGVPVILFCRGSCLFAQELASLHPDAISLDWSGDLVALRQQIPRTIALQGNLDPMYLYGNPSFFCPKVDQLLEGMQGEKGYIFNLGHGLLPDTPVDHVAFLVDYVHMRSRAIAPAT